MVRVRVAEEHFDFALTQLALQRVQLDGELTLDRVIGFAVQQLSQVARIRGAPRKLFCAGDVLAYAGSLLCERCGAARVVPEARV